MHLATLPKCMPSVCLLGRSLLGSSLLYINIGLGLAEVHSPPSPFFPPCAPFSPGSPPPALYRLLEGPQKALQALLLSHFKAFTLISTYLEVAEPKCRLQHPT